MTRAAEPRWLGHPAVPVVAGLVTAVLVAITWGALDAPGAYHDERAYLVQARLLAAFTWTAPTPPVPMAWEMAHVFLEPALFAKYPPGHAPFLVPGIWLGLPALMPTLLAGLSAALLVALVRRHADAWTALVAWLLWTTSPSMLTWSASYYSEVTTGALWLAALLALGTHVRSQGTRSLVVLTALVAWMGITRPVTAIALAIPIAAVVLRVARHRRSVRGFARAAAAGLAICAIIPYWNWSTTGSVRELPYASYSRYYFPFDMPGFTRDGAAPLRPLPPDLEALAADTRVKYEGHVPARMPANFVARGLELVRASLPPYLAPLAVAAPFGLVVAGAPAAFVLGASFVLMVVAYLVMPHGPDWTIYYLEVFPVVPILVAAALLAAVRRAGTRLRSGPGYLFALLLAVTAVLMPGVLTRLEIGRLRPRARQLVAEELLAGLPDQRAVVFVRRDARLSPHFTVHDIRGIPDRTPLWVVRDLGDSLNTELLRAAGGRAPYLLDEVALTLAPYAPGPRSAPPSSGSSRSGSE